MPSSEILALLKEGSGYGIATLLIIVLIFRERVIMRRDSTIARLNKERLDDAKIIIETAQKCAQALTNSGAAIDLSSKANADSVNSRVEFAHTLENFESVLEQSLKFFGTLIDTNVRTLSGEVSNMRQVLDLLRERK